MENFNAESFGRGLLWLRHFQGLTQAEVAARAGIERGRLSNYEAGIRTPRLEVLQQIVGALDADLADLQGALAVVGDRNFRRPDPPSAPPLYSEAPESPELAMLSGMMQNPQLALAVTQLLERLDQSPAGWQSDS